MWEKLVLLVAKALSQDMSTLRSTAMGLKLDVSSEIKTWSAISSEILSYIAMDTMEADRLSVFSIRPIRHIDSSRIGDESECRKVIRLIRPIRPIRHFIYWHIYMFET